MYVNSVKLIGFVGHVDVRTSSQKKPFAKITLSTTKSYTDREGKLVSRTIWHTVCFFGQLVEVIRNQVSDGSYVYISGELGYDQMQTSDAGRRTSGCIYARELIVLETPKQSDLLLDDWEPVNDMDTADANQN